MLYLTTRSKTETYTAYRTLAEDRSPDGGYFLPFYLPRLDPEKMSTLSNQSFGQNIAYFLNVFFSAKLTGWDIDCAIGKTPVNMLPLGHKTVLCQLWANPECNYAFVENALYRLLYSEKKRQPTVWARIAIGTSILCSVCLQQFHKNIALFDVSVADGDFLMAVSACYAKRMGLPIGNIIFTGREESGLWDLINRGILSDSLYPSGLEMFLFAELGFTETQKYLHAVTKRTADSLEENSTLKLKDAMYISVIGTERIPLLKSNCYSSFKVALDADCALAYGGLQDYRAKTGSSEWTLILSQSNPSER